MTNKPPIPGIVAAMTSELRTIRKYPNRRLYDTVESRYITLADVRRLVIEHIEFVVIDAKTQGDITRSILLQVISELERGGEPLMSRDFLYQMIRSYGAAGRSVMGSYLEQSVKLFAPKNGGDAGAEALEGNAIRFASER